METHFLQGIDTIILRVSNVNESKLWFIRKLGFQSIHEDEKLKLVVLDTYSPTSLTLWQTDEPIKVNPRTASYPIFRTSDARVAHQKMEEQGISVGPLTTDHVVTYFTFEDRDGNVLEVCQVHH